MMDTSTSETSMNFSTRQHGAKAHKTAIFFLATVRNSESVYALCSLLKMLDTDVDGDVEFRTKAV